MKKFKFFGKLEGVFGKVFIIFESLDLKVINKRLKFIRGIMINIF